MERESDRECEHLGPHGIFFTQRHKDKGRQGAILTREGACAHARSL